MGRPVVMPDVNIAHLFRDGLNAVLLQNGSAEEIATKCIDLFSDSKRANRIGLAGRQLAKKYFEGKTQARRLEKVYQTACKIFNPGQAFEIWGVPDENTPVTLRLARKLQFVAASGNKQLDYQASDFLREYARYIEFMNQRVRGLETDMAMFHGERGLLTQQVAERDGQIVQLRQEVAERDGRVAHLHQQVVEYGGRLTTLKHQIVERGQQIVFLNQQVVDRDGQIVQLRQEVAGRDGQIVQLHQEVAGRDGQIVQLHQEIAGRDGQIVQLHHEVADRDGLVALLHQHIVDRDRQIAQLHHQVAERDGQVAHLTKQVIERDGQIAVLDRQVAERVELLIEIVASKSWRVTAPLRIIANQLRRVRQALKTLPSFVNDSGGVANAMRKTLDAFREDGVSGVRNRVHDKIGGSGVITVPPSVESDPVSVDKNDYSEWIRRYDRMNEATRLEMAQRLNTMPHTPRISILMPTYNPGVQWLKEAIESVRRQIYPHWELCIADDASSDKTIRPILESYAKEEPRIKVVFREKNGHISAASNSALKLVTGEWVALLDHDDLLAEHALFCVAEAINHHPDVRLIYSDEDKIDDLFTKTHFALKYL
jgi:peptidoglycan hydrolase CwlO-like protein